RDRASERVVARKVRTVRVARIDVAGIRCRIVEVQTRLVGAEVTRAGMVIVVERSGWTAHIPRTQEWNPADRKARDLRARLGAVSGKGGVDEVQRRIDAGRRTTCCGNRPGQRRRIV